MITLPHPAKTIVLSAPSGTGKTSIEMKLVAKIDNLQRSISVTTRKKRTKEVDGKDYFFISKSTFETQLKNGSFIESAFVHGNYYGTSLEKVKEAHRHDQYILLVIDTNGKQQIKIKLPDSISIFVLPPSYQDLYSRLQNRKSENKTSLLTRIQNGKKEIQECLAYDYLVKNQEIDQCSEDIVTILTGHPRASQFTPAACQEFVKQLLNQYPK